MTAQDLKNSILQLAVEGKLLSRKEVAEALENTEGPKTGTELLEQIKAEKARLIAEGKIKKDTTKAGASGRALAEITEDEKPFDIPENWCWCRLGEIVFNHGQKTPDVNFSYIDIGSIDNLNQKLNKNENIITSDKAPSRARKIVKKGDIIYSTVRPYLHNTCIIDKDFICEPIASTGFAVFSCPNGLLNKFLFYFLLSPFFDSYANANENAKGVAYPAINDDRLYKAIVPLPPLAEQKAIVAKIEELLPYIQKYDVAHTKLQEFNKKFPVEMQKSILQQAIMGKLTENWRNEQARLAKTNSAVQLADRSSAKDLLEKIKAQKARLITEGKIKKDKPLAEITEDEIPFDIPESWCWVRLRDICTKIVDGDHNPPHGLETKTDYIMASSQNINFDSLVELDKVRYLSEEVFRTENERTRANEGDVFFTSVGTLGRSCVYTGGLNICFQRSVSVITTLIFNKYLKYFLDSPDNQSFIISNATGTAQKGFYLNQLEKLVVPLPPLAEQKLIVAKIEELLPLCKKLVK